MSSPSRNSASFSSEITAHPKPALVTLPFARILWVQFSFGFAFCVYQLIPKYLATELGASATTIGAVSSTSLLAGVAVSPFIGRALDRYGRRPLLLLGVVVSLVTALGMASVTGVGPWLYALRILQGIGFAMVLNATTALVADIAPAERLGNAMGLLGAASLITNALAPALAETVAHAWSWNAVFLGTALMCALTLAIAAGVNSPPPRSEIATSPAKPREFAGLLYAGAVTGAGFGTLITFTQPFALELGRERVAGFFFGYAVSALLMRLALGNLADRIGRRRVARFALAGYGAVTLAAATLQPDWLELYGLGFGVAHGLLYPSLAALVAERADPAHRGRALTLFNAAFNAGCGLALLGFGLLAEHTGYPLVFALVGGWIIASVPILNPAADRDATLRRATPRS